MHDYEIRKLSDVFYNDYDQIRYPELLDKVGRSYDLVLFQIEELEDCFICVPFRSEMKHANGYKFRHSKRSKNLQSGLDFTKLAVIKDEKYIGNYSTVDRDEFYELERNQDTIHRALKKYILDYYNHINGIRELHYRTFQRRYRFSTLSYFHEELGLT